MKLQIITNLFPLPWEPNRAAFNRQQFENLSQQDDVRLLIIVPWLTCFKNLKNMVPKIKNNIKISYVWYFHVPKVGRFLYPFFLFSTLIFKYFEIKKNNPQCLLLSWAFPDAIAGTMLSRLLKIPAVIKIHGSDINMHSVHPLRARQIVWSMKKAKAVVSVSRAMANKLIEIGVPEDKIHVIYNGVNKKIFFPISIETARDSLKLPHDKKILLYIGNILQEKGCHDLLEAFREVAKNDSRVDLYYVGPGKKTVELLARAKAYGLQQRVFFTGGVDHSELPKWINASNLVVLASHNEGVPNVLLEAMACGKPVVATNVGGIPEVVSSQAGLLVDRKDIVALSQALMTALQHPWVQSQIVDSMSEFTWENNTKLIREVLKSEVH